MLVHRGVHIGAQLVRRFPQVFVQIVEKFLLVLLHNKPVSCNWAPSISHNASDALITAAPAATYRSLPQLRGKTLYAIPVVACSFFSPYPSDNHQTGLVTPLGSMR